ncbi:MAG: hypothetical protein RLZZ102_799 [Pseudomonadota bacterium]|jgi:hypothetical protein
MSEAKKSNAFIKKLVKYAIIFVMAYLVITKIVPWGLKFNMYGTDKFDSKLWIKEWERIEIQATKSNDKSHKYVHYRCSMYNDLTNNHLKKGMKLKEVTDMLGDEGQDLQYYCTNKKVKCLTYTLGSCLKGMFNKSLIVEFFGYYDRQFMYVCFDGNEEFSSGGKSFGDNKYPYSVCGSKDHTVACGKYSGECTKAPWISNTGTVIHDKIEFEQW